MELKEYLELVRPEEGLKLEKNSKGYNWEVKLNGKVDSDMISRMEQINDNLKKKFNLTNDLVKEAKE